MKRIFYLLLLISASSFGQYPMPIRTTALSSGPFVPTSISNCKLWLTADSITGLSNGGAIATWLDKSGNNNDATSTNSPTWNTGQINGHPAVSFTSGLSQLFDLTTGIPSTTDLTIFAVYIRNSGVAIPISGILTDASGYPAQYEFSDNNTYFAFGGNDVNYSGLGGSATWIYTSITSKTTNINKLWIKGVSQALTTVPFSSGTYNLQRIGQLGVYSLYSDMYMYQLIIYDKELNTTERQQVETWIAGLTGL